MLATETEKIIHVMALTLKKSYPCSLGGGPQELRLLRKQGKINKTTMMTIIAKLDLRQISLVGSQRNYELLYTIWT